MNRSSLATLLLLLFPPAYAEEAELHHHVSFESGFLGVQNHRIMFSEKNTYFDYVEDGAQDTLFSYQRYTVDVGRPGDYLIRFVYQPIDLQTSATLQEDLQVDNVSFAAGTPMAFRYSFPYYRATYMWNVVNSATLRLYAGLGLQIRNATISFANQEGTQRVDNRDVGPVPLFSMTMASYLTPATALTFEAEGNYANTSYINGDDDSGVKGAIFDTAVGLQSQISKKISVLSKFRYLTGGAEGTGDEKKNPTGDGYNSNWIDVMAFSLGLSLHLDAW